MDNADAPKNGDFASYLKRKTQAIPDDQPVPDPVSSLLARKSEIPETSGRQAINEFLLGGKELTEEALEELEALRSAPPLSDEELEQQALLHPEADGDPGTPERAMHVSFATALSKGAPPPGNLAVPVYAHGSLKVELYSPRESDVQKPHSRDEIYVVIKGEGSFFDGDATHRVESGSFIFVPAGQRHRFEQFTSDFSVWVFFYGPEGGETSEEHRSAK